MQEEKLSFASDYMRGAHPNIIRRLAETNMMKTAGYGLDEISEHARERIRKACACREAAVEFLVGGTQTNALVIDAFLRPWQGVIAADTGHISTHEAGAIEANGHKVLTIPQLSGITADGAPFAKMSANDVNAEEAFAEKNTADGMNARVLPDSNACAFPSGKISADAVDAYMSGFLSDPNHDHMVVPGMVYLSQPTEYGTLYSAAELRAFRKVCDQYGLFLYIDGARLAYALACPENDVSLEILAEYCDAFYIGGTKCGALFGEALVVPNPQAVPHLFTLIKQHGALLAKGRVLGIQFDELFREDLYLQIGKPAIAAADRIRAALRSKGYQLHPDSPTNQIFCVMEDTRLAELSRKVEYSFWEKADESHTVIRLATDWATGESETEELIEML